MRLGFTDTQRIADRAEGLAPLAQFQYLLPAFGRGDALLVGFLAIRHCYRRCKLPGWLVARRHRPHTRRLVTLTSSQRSPSWSPQRASPRSSARWATVRPREPGRRMW